MILNQYPSQTGYDYSQSIAGPSFRSAFLSPTSLCSPPRLQVNKSSISRTMVIGMRSELLSPWSPVKRTSRYMSRPPRNGTSPISQLPDELWLEVLGWLELDDLLVVRGVNRRLSTLALSPTLHQSLTLQTLPSNPLPDLLQSHILPSIHHLHLHSFPFSSRLKYGNPATRAYFHPSNTPSSRLFNLLNSIPVDQLRTLSLPFSGYLYDNDLSIVLRRIGGRLEKLELKGSEICGGDWIGWIEGIGKNGRGLRHLDMGYTGISTLPIDNINEEGTLILPPHPPRLNPFHSLISLSIASCPSLSLHTLTTFFKTLPPSIEHLNLSHLDILNLTALMDLRVVIPSDEGNLKPTKLKEIKVVGIDNLTRRDIRTLKSYWENQRRACFPIIPLSTPNMNETSPPKTPDMKARKVLLQNSSGGVPMTRGRWETPVLSPSSSSSGSPGSLLTPPGSNMGLPTDHPFFRSRLSNKVIGSAKPMTSWSEKYRSGNVDSGVTESRLRFQGVGGSMDNEEEDWVTIEIAHSAVLESEDEEGYRRFIGEVVGGTMILEFQEEGYVNLDDL